MSETIEVFISYSKQDKELRDGLLSHLRPLERQGIITWHDRQILPGTEWDEEIKARLNAADIILLLISADFLATDYCTQVEIPEALRRHEAGEATVMPVILRSCGWKYTPLAKIQAYPEKAKPIVSWTYIDDAYTDVVDGVYVAATEILKRQNQQQLVEVQESQQEKAEIERRKQQEQLKQTEERKQQQQQNGQNQSLDDLKGDYSLLEALLKAGEWEKADEETAKKMIAVMGKQQFGYLTVEDIKQFPCADLCAIDQLWVKYSKGKFGFSVQKKIWQKHGEPVEYNAQWKEFAVEVGWRKKGLWGIDWAWKDRKELTYNTSLAPEGHLPALTMRGYYKSQRTTYSVVLALGEYGVGGKLWVIFSRTKTCQL